MNFGRAGGQLQLPETLRAQLLEFRRRVWSRKTAQALFVAVFGIVVAYLAMFSLDRLWETPGGPRLALFGLGAFAVALIPVALYRWVWSNRRADQLARLLTRKHPHIGDQLLGIIELVGDDSEQARSRRLCEAAIEQVARDAQKRDFSDAVPSPRHRMWAGLAAVPAIAAVALMVTVPAAATNAWARLLAPWSNTPRYTFAALAPLPAKLVVPHGETFAVTAKLADGTAWSPKQAVVQLGSQRPIAAKLVDGQYVFTLPPQTDAATLVMKVGDARRQLKVEPVHRPELTAVAADITLPDYLKRPAPVKKDVRGGTVTMVRGSRATFSATASRALAAAWVDGKPANVSGSTVTSPMALVSGPLAMEFRWKDELGLEGKEPFGLTITGREDEAPSLGVEDLPRQRVVLDTEQLNFKVRAQDDFGIKEVGIEWVGVDDPTVKSPAKGERKLAAGGFDKESLDVVGTFTAKTLGIEPQPIHVRVYAQDYFPDRERTYSTTYTLFILNAEQHAIWLTEQLSKWHRQSLEVRDREMQLFETNKQLRALSPEELDQPDTRRKIENQAAAERANGRRLSNLVVGGEELVRQAMRNPEFGVGHLEKWGEMLQILKDIAGNRMPSVADLLKQGAQAPALASESKTKGKTAMAGKVLASSKGGPVEMDPKAKPLPSAPTVADRESQHSDPNKPGDQDQAPDKKKPSNGTLRLPMTTLAGKPKKEEPKPDDPAAADVEEAVEQQQDLLAEFEKISEELNKVLANLEGSTLVKRLKAASRTQYKVAGRLGDHVNQTFGAAMVPAGGAPAKVLGEMAETEAKSTIDVSFIMDDMQSYFERRQYVAFKSVLDDMRKQDVIGGLRSLGDDLRKENGVSIAQAEYWSDNLDRWAEDLVDPAALGKCPGGKSRGSLPPSIVLEVLQVLEAEINLREETRVAEKAKPALSDKEHLEGAKTLSKAQAVLKERIDKVSVRIRDLPEGEELFAKELDLLAQVSEVMDEAAGILATPETGSTAIAAETEAIELLLKSKRINPKGGGGGGSSPGGGGGGTTTDSALSLIGKGLNLKEVREDHGVSQATGDTGPTLPEEFRAGLDEYFNRLEKKPTAK